VTSSQTPGSTSANDPEGFRTRRNAVIVALIGLLGVAVVAPIVTGFVTRAHTVQPERTITASPPIPAPKPLRLAITSPTHGADVGKFINVTGSVTGLQPGDLIWTFDEPYNANGRPTGMFYPNLGPCPVDGTTWRCDGIGLGDTGTASSTGVGQYIVWAVAVDSREAFNIVSTIRCLAPAEIVATCPFSVTELPGSENTNLQSVPVTRTR
jgi:hypothetical protein